MGLISKPGSRYYWINIKIGHKRIFESTRTENKRRAQEILSIRHAELLNEKTTSAGKESEPQELKEKKETKPYTFNELVNQYLDWVNGRQRSYSRKKSVVKKLKERFGNMELNDFNYRTLEAFQTDCIRNDFKPAYVNKIITVFKHMFTKALDWEMIAEETFKQVRKVKLLKGEVKRLRYLSDEEAERLIFNCEPYLKPIVVCALNTGMRKSEIFNLTWDRVDLKNRIILLDKTKNGDRREIPINQTLLNVLSSIVRNIKTDYVFYNPETLKPYYDIKKGFQAALKRAHIMDFHFHDLRHTFASRLVMAGADLATIQKLLGHKTINMTLRYAHLSNVHLKDAVNLLDTDNFKKHYTFIIPDENLKLSNS